MRAWLTIDGVEFVTDEWEKRPAGAKVFSLMLRPVGTRAPGLAWWFSEGVWGEANPAENFLVKIEKVEVEREREIQKEDIREPLWGRPGDFGEGEADTLRFDERLDLAARLFGGYGKESFCRTKDGGVRMKTPFFDAEASFNNAGADGEKKEPPGREERRRDDVRTFIEICAPGKGDTRDPQAGVTEGAWWKKPMARTWKEFREDGELQGWQGSFVELSREIARREEDNKGAYKNAVAAWERRMRWVMRGAAAALALGLLAWGAWRMDGSKVVKIRQQTKAGLFVQAAKSGQGFFFYGKGQARVAGALRDNQHQFDSWIERKKEEYGAAKREGRWADAKTLGEEMAANGGRKPEDWDDVALLVQIERARDKAEQIYQTAMEHGSREELEDAIVAFEECRKMFTPGAEQLYGGLKKEIEDALRNAEAWDLKEKMDGEVAAQQWAAAVGTAEELMGREGVAPQIRQAAEAVLRKWRSLRPRYDELAGLLGEPEQYLERLVRLTAEYGDTTVLELLKADISGTFRKAMVALVAPAIQAARGGRGIPAGIGPKTQWVLVAEQAGVKGLELVSGWLVYYGIGCERDADRAARHFEAAAREEKNSQGQASFMAGVVRAEQGRPEEAIQWMKMAEKAGVLEAVAVLMGKGERPITPEGSLLAATNLPSVRTACAINRLKAGRRNEGIAILKRVVQAGHYPPAELWLSAMVGASEPDAKVFYQKNVAQGTSGKYPRPFTRYRAVMAQWASLGSIQGDSYVIEELLAKGAEQTSKISALESAIDRGDVWTAGILLSANTLSVASSEQVAKVLNVALVQEDPQDLLWCCLRVATEHWAESRKTNVVAAMQGQPEVVRNKARRLFGMQPERSAANSWVQW